MRLSAIVAVAFPALAAAQYNTAPVGNAPAINPPVGTAPSPPSTTTQTSTTLLVKTIFLSRVNPVTSSSSMAQYNSTASYLPIMANATQPVVTNTGTASNMLPTPAATLPPSQVISAAGSLDAKPIALTGLAALLAFVFL
ncbi:hypothetical protein CP532_2095 [Ophiocordyceps camponoti-leonardi (nom. inval.)]|nr:hypothetical protein CP532_2095 [Ophiocordyceps camponoti-leonardi (nom. inval.)]